MNEGNRFLRDALSTEVPVGLPERVQSAVSLVRIRQERLCHAVRMSCAAVSLASFGGIFFSIKAFLVAATASGFTAYTSLGVSDSSLVSAHFSSFLASLAESLPSTQMTIVLALVAVFLVSVRNAVAYGMQKPRYAAARTQYNIHI
ncbi:MAG: hypothetical protein JWL88_27 [Parcubacteria group bacterium]|nr:hypothetical protein [Parcubacteria group bacterium]